MKKADYMSVAEQAMKQIKKGAFLTVKSGSDLNTMTIGWATIGIVWQKPIFMVAVRDSRYTFTIIENADDFAVSVPLKNMTDEIRFCGTKSGRNVDKFKECKFSIKNSRTIFSPIINISGIHFECKIVFKSAMDQTFLIDEYEKLYPQKDYHTLYFGEILDCYKIE
ncbi:MAG: flavin reductase family protein [Desulfobacterales bacterium]|nr:flavin reductase family protein [Desulfobacterales bacterium]